MGERVEYRVVWKRVGQEPKRKRYVNKKRADGFAAILTDKEPWKRYKRDPDAFYCCSGYECGCGGKTVRQSFEEQFDGMPEIEYVRIESREVGPWVTP